MASEPERKPAAPGASGVPVKLGSEAFDAQSVPLSWLADADQDEIADEIDRRTADLEWVNDLAFAQFSGPAWNYTAEELAKYGMGVIGGWMYRGLIYERCKSKGLGGLTPIGRPFSKEEIEEITGETVAKALNHFRTDVLMKGKWDHRRGASLRTYFVGQCLIRFANIYRRWLGNETRGRQHALTDDTALIEYASKAHVESPAGQALDRVTADETLARVKNLKVQKAIILTAAGRSQAEIAIELEATEKAVERMLGNQRDRFRETG